MQALMEAGLSGVKARIPSAETMTNEYIYADDMGRAVDLAVTKSLPKGAIFNIGNGFVTPFEDVVAAVRAHCPALNYEIEAGEPPKNKAVPLSISAAEKHLDWRPAHDIVAGFGAYLSEIKAARAQGF
jgi:nucleoside-diphosphate-sugar epimerase